MTDTKPTDAVTQALRARIATLEQAMAEMSATLDGYKAALDSEGDAHIKTALRMHSDDRVRHLVEAARAADAASSHNMIKPAGRPAFDAVVVPRATFDALRSALAPFAKRYPEKA